MTIVDLNKKYDGKKVVNSVSFEIPKGKVLSLIGPNGAGKSTVMGMISRLIAKDSGIINFEDKDLIAFEKLVSFLKPYNFKIHFIHYNNNDDNWAEIKLSGIKEYFQKHYSDIEFEYHLLDGEDILSAYDKFIHDNNIDVVSMTTHRRNLFSRLFNPSMARKMVFHTDTPMLVFHA